MSASGVPFPDSPRTMRRLPAASRAHVRAACATLILSLSLSACAMEQTSSFDSGAWKAQRGVAATENTRGGMVAAAEAVVQPGMSREDVLRLLGEPDATDAATATDTYELGVAKFGVDEEYLAIHYRDGKVESRQWQRR